MCILLIVQIHNIVEQIAEENFINEYEEQLQSSTVESNQVY